MRATARELLLGLSLLCACAAQHGTIGAVLGQQPDGRIIIREVPPGLAAAKAGLKEGDEILLVDGRDVRALDEKQLSAVLGGEVDSPVKLTVVRGEEVLRVTLRRTASRKYTPAE